MTSSPTSHSTTATSDSPATRQSTEAANLTTWASTATKEHAAASGVEALDGCERCYLFVKWNRLATDTLDFPEALDLIAASQNNETRSYKTAGSGANSTLFATMYESAELAAKRRASSARMAARYSFEQGQLINMKRQRNLLRYRLGRLSGPLVLDETDDNTAATGNLATDGRVAGSKGAAAAAKGRQAGRQKRRKTTKSPRGRTNTKGKRQAEVERRRPETSFDETTCDDYDPYLE